MKTFRSQCGEDKWIERHWSRLGLPDRGFFVEFGSGDGEHFSNTYHLQWARGWTGLLMDADPRNHGTRPGVLFERVAIGPAGEVSFGLHPQDGYLSGVLRESYDEHIVQRITMRTEPLSSVLKRLEIPRVDLISIDTEGTELECWRTLDLALWRPRVAIIELDTWKLSDRSAEVVGALKADGYVMVKRTQLNGIFQDTKTCA